VLPKQAPKAFPESLMGYIEQPVRCDALGCIAVFNGFTVVTVTIAVAVEFSLLLRALLISLIHGFLLVASNLTILVFVLLYLS
jgi:hypothetical protein